MARSDTSRTGPGKQVWLDMFGSTPTLVIIDELAQYLRRLGSSGEASVRALARATIDSLKVLFEAATAASAVRVVFTLATGTDAFQQETRQVKEALDEIAEQKVLAEARDVMERPKGAIGRPADEHEIGFILRRRLFSRVDEASADAAFAAYKSLYTELADRDVPVGPATSDPAGYCDRIRTSYPFHPALIDCLDKRIGPLPGFQRARGALKMLAETVREIWIGNAGAAQRAGLPIINLGDLPLEAIAVRASITSSIDRESLDGPARADFAGADAHAVGVDAERWPVGRLATRACRTVFCHSVAGEPAPGAASPDVHLGTLRPGENPETLDEALAVVSRVAWHLVSDGARWRFQVEPNANRIVAAELANVSQADVTEELSRIVERLFASDGPVRAVHRPVGPADVADEATLHLAVMDWTDTGVLARSAASPPQRVADIAERAGAAETSRSHRNAVIFLVADEGELEAMRERVSFELAAGRIRRDPQRLQQFSQEVGKRLTRLADQSKLNTRISVCRAYRHLYWPAPDAANHNLRHFELSPAQQGDVKGSQTKVLLKALRNCGKIADSAPATDSLARSSGFARSGEITTESLAKSPWRDPGRRIPLKPGLIRDTISAGIRNGTWIYYDADSEKAYSTEQSPPAVRIASDTWLYSTQRAQELKLLRQPLTVSRISDAIARDSPEEAISGPALRSRLEASIGGEPTKKEVLDVLASGLQAADSLVVVDASAGSTRALTAAAVRRGRLDDLEILTAAKAVNRGIVVPDRDPAPKVEGKGSVGRAFQEIDDHIADLGLRTISSVTVRADARRGEGIRDLRILGLCIPQLPGFDCRIKVSTTSEYQGLKGGLKAELSGETRFYQRIEESLLNLADAGRAVTGYLTVELTPAAEMRHGDDRWNQLRDVIATNNPGRIIVIAQLARPD